MSPPDTGKLSAARLLAEGLVGSSDQLAVARSSVSGQDRGHPQRALDVSVAGGLSVRLLPDRGLDVGAAWWDGIPLAWLSRVGEVSGRPTDAPDDWIQAFGGGLITTCGLQNVGRPSEGFGQHGAFSSTPASAVEVDRDVVGEQLEISVSGLVAESDALDTFLECRRRVTTRTGVGLLMLDDVVTNRGSELVAAPMLYHVNLGAPLWSPGARIEVADRTDTVPRDDQARAFSDDWKDAPAPSSKGRERVYEHIFSPGEEAGVRVVNERLDVVVGVRWNTATMPRVHQWVHPRTGIYVLGIEPANCSVLGRAADRAAGRLPILEPGESRATFLRITAERVS